MKLEKVAEYHQNPGPAVPLEMMGCASFQAELSTLEMHGLTVARENGTANALGVAVLTEPGRTAFTLEEIQALPDLLLELLGSMVGKRRLAFALLEVIANDDSPEEPREPLH